MERTRGSYAFALGQAVDALSPGRILPLVWIERTRGTCALSAAALDWPDRRRLRVRASLDAGGGATPSPAPPAGCPHDRHVRRPSPDACVRRQHPMACA